MALFDSDIVKFLRNAAWTTRPGNSIDYEYYTGVEAGNPSGNTNLKSMTYNSAEGVEFVVSYTWDADDNVLSETCSRS